MILHLLRHGSPIEDNVFFLDHNSDWDESMEAIDDCTSLFSWGKKEKEKRILLAIKEISVSS